MTIAKIAGEFYAALDRFSAQMADYGAGSVQSFEADGEIAGICRALALMPARTWADWHVKDGVLRERCAVTVDERHSAVELDDEVNALLAASLLDDASALLKGEGLALAA